jgi:hypothetical protein
MSNKYLVLLILLLMTILVYGFRFQDGPVWSLDAFEPEHYRYVEAETCFNCKQSKNDIMTRVVGVDISSGTIVLDGRGWLSSVHARSQSHGDRVNTACAWCHAPTAAGATRDKTAAKPIEKGTWQGVTCGACHPGSVKRELRKSLLVNLTPGSDRSNPDSYTFYDKTEGSQFNTQCRFCHHESHDLLLKQKTRMLEAGDLRCIDCHMAGYAIAEGRRGTAARFHNFKVAANLPWSCNGKFGVLTSCHTNASKEWMETSITKVKGPRKSWD